MSSVTRVDQAMLLLKERLRGVQERSAGSAAAARGTADAGRADPLAPLRQLIGQGAIGERELRRALVRTLLEDAFGEGIAGSLEFSSVADQVSLILEESEAGRAMLDRAIGELS